MKGKIKQLLPNTSWEWMKARKRQTFRNARKIVESAGYVVARKTDYYSPLPSEFELERQIARWNKPSALYGIKYDLAALELRMADLVEQYYDEFMDLPSYRENQLAGFGQAIQS